MKNELNKSNLEKHRLHENFHNCSYKSIVNEKWFCVENERKCYVKILVIKYLLKKEKFKNKKAENLKIDSQLVIISQNKN